MVQRIFGQGGRTYRLSWANQPDPNHARPHDDDVPAPPRPRSGPPKRTIRGASPTPPHTLNKKIRLTLDYKEDLKFFRALYKRVSILEKTINIVEFLEKNDNIRKLNYHLEEFWRKNQLKEVSSHEKRN